MTKATKVHLRRVQGPVVRAVCEFTFRDPEALTNTLAKVTCSRCHRSTIYKKQLEEIALSPEQANVLHAMLVALLGMSNFQQFERDLISQGWEPVEIADAVDALSTLADMGPPLVLSDFEGALGG